MNKRASKRIPAVLPAVALFAVVALSACTEQSTPATPETDTGAAGVSKVAEMPVAPMPGARPFEQPTPEVPDPEKLQAFIEAQQSGVAMPETHSGN